MGASGEGSGSRAARSRGKTRPILTTALARAGRRDAATVTAGRTKGVERPTDQAGGLRPRRTPLTRSLAGPHDPHSARATHSHGSFAPGSAPDAPSETLLVAEAVATALESLTVLERHTGEVADAFRWNRLGDAQHGLAELVQSTQSLLQLAAMVAQATGVDFGTLCGPEGLRAKDDTSDALDLIIEQQLADDWAALSDTLDQDFTSVLTQWRLVFETLGGMPPQGGPGGRAA